MKKLISMYKAYMFHPVLYKTVTRASIVAVLCLLWDRFVSEGHFTIWEGPVLVCGIVLLGWAWLGYLSLDGMSIRHLFQRDQEKPEKHRRVSRSIVDYADEKIVSFEELEPDERTYCSLLSNVILGLPLTLVGALASVL